MPVDPAARVRAALEELAGHPPVHIPPRAYRELQRIGSRFRKPPMPFDGPVAPFLPSGPQGIRKALRFHARS
jgi:hypothetical protein